MLLGTCLRMLATLPPYEARLMPRTKFWLVFAANMMVNTGHPVLITMSTKVIVRGGEGRGGEGRAVEARASEPVAFQA